jgi:hypothetical protein
VTRDNPGYLLFGKVDEEGTFGITRALRADEADRFPRPVIGLGSHLLVRVDWADGVSEGVAPAIFDPATGQVHVIAEMKESYVGNHVLAATEGPFLRVNTPGDCLNIRASIGLDAPVLTCAADGVLLEDRQDVWERDGVTWLAVSTPEGEPGWAAAEYLR